MISPEIFAYFSHYIEQEIGITYSPGNSFQLEGRLQEIVKYAGLKDIEELHQLAKKGLPRELRQLLLDVATNNETSFFRDREVFEAIEKKLVPELLSKNAPDQQLKIWSAASSYGQEAISLAILLNEMRLGGTKVSGSIWASDISEKVLKRAMTGTFTQLEIQRGLPIRLLPRYFEETNGTWKVKAEILNTIRFFQQNLLAPFSVSGPFDIILCRNVLIYQSVENKSRIIENLRKLLKPDGFLIMGAGESLLGISNEFRPSSFDGMICYRKKKDAVNVA